MQIISDLRFYLSSFQMATINKANDNCQWGSQERGALHSTGRNASMAVTQEVSLNYQMVQLSRSCVYSHIPAGVFAQVCSLMLYSQQLRNGTSPGTHQQMSGQRCDVHSRASHNQREKWNWAICRKTVATGNCNAKWKDSDSTRQMLNLSSHTPTLDLDFYMCGCIVPCVSLESRK